MRAGSHSRASAPHSLQMWGFASSDRWPGPPRGRRPDSIASCSAAAELGWPGGSCDQQPPWPLPAVASRGDARAAASIAWSAKARRLDLPPLKPRSCARHRQFTAYRTDAGWAERIALQGVCRRRGSAKSWLRAAAIAVVVRKPADQGGALCRAGPGRRTTFAGPRPRQFLQRRSPGRITPQRPEPVGSGPHRNRAPGGRTTGFIKQARCGDAQHRLDSLLHYCL